jgi:hypothetical protein
MTGWLLGSLLSAVALPGVALAGALPATAAALSANDDPHAAGAPPAATAVSPPPPAAPVAPSTGGVAAPVPSPAPPYAPPPPGYPYAPPPPGYPYAPPPPGTYGYPPPAYLTPSAFAAQRLAVLDAQIRDLQMRHDDISLALPLVLLIAGAVIGVVGLGIVGANVCPKDQYGNREDPSCVENQTGIDQGLSLVVVGSLGVAFGAPSLIIRTVRRRHITRQIEQRQLEANALRPFATPRWGASPVRGGGGLVSLALDF